MNKILLAAAVLAALASQLFPASAIQAAGPVAPFDLPARAVQAYEQRLREQEARQRQQLLTPPPETESAPKGTETLRPGGPCVTIRSIRVEGARLLSDAQTRKLVSPYEGQCLNLDGINAVLQSLTNAYVERGYVTSRAVLGPQDLSRGVLVIKIIEGRVESVGPDAASTMQPKQFLTIFPGVKGSVLQLRDIEQGLDQLNRLPSNNATMRIEPGAEAGSSRVLINNVQKRTWRLSAGVDNLGQETTGLTEYTLGFEKDNFLGCNDQFALYWTSSMPRIAGQFGNPWEGYSDSISGLFSVPFGYWLLSGSVSRFNYSTQIYGLNQAYTSSGTTTAARLALDRVIWRDAASKLSLGTFIQYRDVVNRFEDVRLAASSYRLTTSGLAASYVRRMLSGVLTLQAEQIWGLPTMSWSVPGPVGSTTPHTSFSKTTGTLGWYRPFNVGEQQWAWSLSAYGQTSEQTMYGSERLYLGSSYTVRGFKETPVGGDCGGYVRNELAWTVPEQWLGPLKKAPLGQVRLFAAYDYGGIARDGKDPYEWGEMHGMALGLRTSGDFSVQAAWSHPLGAPDYVKERDDVWYLTLRYTF